MADDSNLTSRINSPVECHVFDSVNSTNDYLSSLVFSEATQICIAREQTQGKGQYDRAWISQKDASVLFSIRYVFDSSTTLNGLSLVIGLAVIQTLKEFGVTDAKLKWPNDVLIDDKKLAGILIENSVQGDCQSVVIGLGLNYDLTQTFECDSPWIDLSSIMQSMPTIENLSSALINGILEYCQLFSVHQLSYFLKFWEGADYLLSKQVELDVNDCKIIGIVIGVSQHGALKIEADGQVFEAYSSKQIRLI
jgi:BirA family transcriptional regulator, biotin operon repressor / biotin---[acetyl-CoA-carboxylase] ligase